MVQTVVAKPETVEIKAPLAKAAQTTSAYTGRVQAEGIASIGASGRDAARQAALNDALRNAVASTGASATDEKLPEVASAPRQTPEALPTRQGRRYSILREWENQGMYHVTVSAETIGGKFDADSAVLVQRQKKKIAITQFDVANTIHVDDISNIYDGLPGLLSSRLEASGRFLSTYASRSIQKEADASQREAIIQIAEETGAQFFISGTVVNAGVSQGKWSFDAPFGGSKKRHIEVEFYVYDGFSGSRLFSGRLNEQAEGDVAVGNNKPFGSSFFLETEFGKATSRLVDSAFRNIQDVLENVPFAAHIIRVEGKQVFLDAGADSLLETGDKLVAYAINTRTPVTDLKGTLLGVTERAADTITLTQVNPQFSIGELSEDTEKSGIKAGDIARINFADQRDLAAKQMAARQLAKAQQEAKTEAERVKAEQAAQAEAARIKAEQAAQAEAARIKEEKKAKAQAAAEAKLKAQKETKTARGSAAQQARARALAVRMKAAQKAKAQAAAEAKSAKSKEKQPVKSETSCAKAELEAKNQAAACASAEAKSQQAIEAGATETKIEQKPQAGAAEAKAANPKTQQEAEPSKVKPEQKDQIQPEVQTAAKNKVQQAVKTGEAKAKKSKRKTLPPGDKALHEKPKVVKP